ncbi:MAG: hypothetical protein J7530_06475 [Novosphingobium sp.]|nr:hypothetical protein [Novosphingobium sp.]
MKSVIRGLMAGTAMTVVAAPAFAQEQSSQAGSTGIGEIVVTAQLGGGSSGCVHPD